MDDTMSGNELKQADERAIQMDSWRWRRRNGCAM